MRENACKLVTLLAVAWLADAVPAQPVYRWTRLSTPGSPSSRHRHAIANDAARSLVVLFGGQDYFTGGYLDETWLWQGAWVRKRVAAPSARFDPEMVYDAARQEVVLFGGSDAGSPVLGDTWAWDGTAWVQRQPLGSPPARTFHAMAYDAARQEVVLFGGRGSSAAYTWLYESVPVEAAVRFYGWGCPAHLMLVTMSGLPQLGTIYRPIVNNVPFTATMGVMTLGGSNSRYGAFSLPLSLGFAGMPGCQLYNDLVAVDPPMSLVRGSLGLSGHYALTIPSVPALAGQHVYLQAALAAPGSNPAGVIVSNGLDLTLGY